MSIVTRSHSRGSARVRVLAVHTTEGTSYTAAGLRDAGWWEGSSHAIADERTLLTPAQGCVPYSQASWTLRSGNPWSENIELVGFAGWSRAQWLARPGLLNNCAKWLADRSKARGIPLVKISPAQYRAGASGVIGHHDHTVGYSDGSHWDPGPNFPWDVVLATARDYAGGIHFQPEDDMTPAESQMLRDIKAEVMAGRRQDYVVLSGQLARLLAAVEANDVDIDETALAAALAPLVIEAIGESHGLTSADVEAAVSRVLARAAQA